MKRARPQPPRSEGRGAAWMLVSAERRRWVPVDIGRVAGGRFHTRGDGWLLPQVRRFLARAGRSRAVDPFAGGGDLLAALAARGLVRETAGYDLDPAAGWPIRDSLAALEPERDAIFVTNPPFLARHSARRKGVLAGVRRHFDAAGRSDLYQVALDRLLAASDPVVAILPETFLGSDYPKERLVSASVLVHSPFEDTECPVLVACFDGRPKPAGAVRLYVGARYALRLSELEARRLVPEGSLTVRFNDPAGPIALQAVDTHSDARRIAFLERRHCAYPPERVRASSRLVTYLALPDVRGAALPDLIARANALLAEHRTATWDLALSPFKGNTKGGRRRRRLDYATARALLERAARSLGL